MTSSKCGLPLLLLFLIVSWSGNCLALDCNKVIATPDINACAAIEQKGVEARLNQVYRQVLKSLDRPDEPQAPYSEMRKSLVAAQRAWVTFREADCDAVYQKYVGGTIRTVMRIGCMQGHAEKRIRDLEDFASPEPITR